MSAGTNTADANTDMGTAYQFFSRTHPPDVWVIILGDKINPQLPSLFEQLLCGGGDAIGSSGLSN
ncbi:hypothetical protein KIN20_011398 [Parelaphostrongylus tenuis]|uniref:Uncharacterized protein n=1 Tax=Parelaphostrongylus tenuis TaxID=148309 RepID=A0AAD5MS14_PARTN|nr:hypothetical protein KIN20_011398 [Parelaphostrongylus tenuis]